MLCCSEPHYKDDTERQLTWRAVGAGLFVGSLLCCSNTYFGLQTGWVTMGSLQVVLRIWSTTVCCLLRCRSMSNAGFWPVKRTAACIQVPRWSSWSGMECVMQKS